MSKPAVKEAAEYLLTGAVVGATVTLLCVAQNSRHPGNGGDRLAALQDTIRDQIAGWIEEMADIVRSGSGGGRKLTPHGHELLFESFDRAHRRLEEGRSDLQARITPSD